MDSKVSKTVTIVMEDINMVIQMPKDVIKIIELLYSYKYEAFIVGGCVRDSHLGKIPNDWDICTDCQPDFMIKIFEENGIKTIPTGLKHGTISLVINTEVYEVTTYRIEGEYIDNRRPSKVDFTKSLTEDLSRRDFTINSMAYNHKLGLADPFNGREDLKNGIIRTVGNPDERFREDALRIIRGVRFATQLGFDIHPNTAEAIKEYRELLGNISKERIQSELNKILISSRPSKGFYLFKELSLLDFIIPELSACVDFNQKNPHHDKDVFEHIMAVLDNTERDLVLRLSALLHDIGKPLTFSEDEEGIGHFYKHHCVGSNISGEMLRSLKYDNNTIKQVMILVKEHMLRHDDISEKAIKRFINRVGKDNINRLFMLQRADIQASKPPHDYSNVNYLENKCHEIINSKQPLTVKDLEINGYDLINLGLKPGKELGFILDYLLEKILEEPELNTKEKLLTLAKDKYIRISVD